MRVVFRVDASLEIGTGHVMRCLALADALRVLGGECVFICRRHKGNLLELIGRSGYRSVGLNLPKANIQAGENSLSYWEWLGANWREDAIETARCVKEFNNDERPDWLIVDHYAIDKRWEEFMRPRVKRIMAIDDLADRMHDCDFLLDQNLGRSAKDYVDLLNSDVRTFIGPRFALLRPEFSAWRGRSRLRRNPPVFKNILISMGGIDKDNATSIVLDALKNCTWLKQLHITVVMGAGSPWLSFVKDKTKQMPWPTQVVVGAKNMAELMAECDFSIGAAGSTSWERCCLGLPSVQVALAENQKLISKALDSAGAAVALEIKDIIRTLPQTLSKFANAQMLQAMSNAASSITDGDGVQLVSRALQEGYENQFAV